MCACGRMKVEGDNNIHINKEASHGVCEWMDVLFI